MADLRTNYMGLELKNPVVAGASNMVTNTDNLKRLEKAGAAAIVYKSLFEEQIQAENLELFERRTEYEERNAEMITLFPNSKSDLTYPEEHLWNLKRAKEAVSIPVIASLNAVRSETWIEYAKKIEETGVDAIELNLYTGPEKMEEDFDNVEKKHIQTVKDVKSAVSIPVSVKLSPYYTNPLMMISEMDKAGADAFVLFNRLFQPDIDIQTEKHIFPYSLSHPEDMRLPMRFAGLLHGNIKASVCSGSGIFKGDDVIKMLLAGSDCVQVVSTLYLNQIEVIGTILSDMEKWMDSKGYNNLNSVRGKLSRNNSGSLLPYRHAQYMDFVMSTSEIMKKYKSLV
ncbi:MAG: dihydroorotate dehydrogenase-like protein [Bacteroidales bacterium]|nr:dihydroorotate dehydrogenase-like protein [Bacteroidales bacterium]